MRNPRLWVGLVVLSCMGCAETQIRKIPNRSDYSSWSDEDQRRVDSMCGLRFYRRRPYVVVKRTFPVKADTFLVDGIVSADGKLARVTADLSDPRFSLLRHANVVSETGEMPLRRVWRPDAAAGAPTPHADTEPGAGGAGGGGGGQTLPAGAARGPDTARGVSDLRLTTDLAAIGYKDLQDYFGVLYLPDFEEEYVIDVRNNLGVSDVSVGKGPGEDLLSLGVSIDNSAIVGPILDAYSSLLTSGIGKLKTAMGLPTTEGVAVPEAHASAESDVLRMGAHVTFRVHVVSMANPGMYPVLKASEMLDRRGQVHKVKDAAACGVGPCDLDPATHVVPCWPYSRIAYQVHRTIIVEHLVSVSDGAGPLPHGASEDDVLVTDAVRVVQRINACCAQRRSCEVTQVVRTLPATGPLRGVTTLTIRIRKLDGTAWGPGEFTQFMDANRAGFEADMRQRLGLAPTTVIEILPSE